MDNTFYKVELSTGKTFNVISFDTLIDQNYEDINQVFVEVPIASITYEKLKELISGEITKVTISAYNVTAPDDYIAPPSLFAEIVFDGYGDIPSIETTKEGNFKIKFFKISAASKLESEYTQSLIESSIAIGSAYEMIL